MLNIDDWRVMYEGQAQDLLKLRASLAKANALSIRADVDRYDYLREIDRLREALEVARRELGEARAWKVEYCRQVAEKDEQVAEVRGEMAGLRDRVGELEKFAEKQPLSYLTPRDGTVILGWSKEWALGSMLMRVNSHGVWVNLHGDAFPDAPTHWAPRVHWPGWINGGPR